MRRFDVSVIACHCAFADEIDKRCSAQLLREIPSLCLADPHQRSLEDEATFHTKIKGDLESFDRVVATIGIPGEVSFANAGYDMLEAAAVGHCGREREEDNVAPRHERVWQAGWRCLDF